jgi:hypothetical protein
VPYRDKAKQRAAQAESARRKRRLKKSAAGGSTLFRFDDEPLLRFRTISDTLSALEQAVNIVLNDPAADSVARARIILQAAANAARAIESGEIEKRIAELERQLTENADDG